MTLKEFYPYYLKEHSHPVNRVLHLIGTSLGLLIVFWALWQGPLWLLLLAFVPGYAFAWIGHFVIEKNRPATFKHPFLSFVCDFKMFFDLVTFRRSIFEMRKPRARELH